MNGVRGFYQKNSQPGSEGTCLQQSRYSIQSGSGWGLGGERGNKLIGDRHWVE